jgi:hypothetical protein
MVDVNEFIQDRRGSALASRPAPGRAIDGPMDVPDPRRHIDGVRAEHGHASITTRRRTSGSISGRSKLAATRVPQPRWFRFAGSRAGLPSGRVGGDLMWMVLRRPVVDSVAVRGRGPAPRLRRRAVTPSACALHSSQLVEVAQFLEDVHASLEVALIAG